MYNSIMLIIVFIGITVGFSIICHCMLKSDKAAVILSALLSVTVFQFVAYVYSGFLDPFFMVAVVITGCTAILISFLIGTFFKKERDH